MDKTKNSLLHKILVMLLSVSLVLGNMTFGGFGDYAYAESEPWDGSSYTEPDDMQQDTAGYYLIATAADLAGFAYMVNEGINPEANAKLTADIDLGNQEWTPIGQDEDFYYCGSFDGQGHTISNLYISEEVEGYDYAGLFGYVNGGSLASISVSGEVYSAYAAGGIAGGGFEASIEECINAANINSDCYTGGIVGEGYGVVISKCKNEGKITAVGQDQIAGGIIAYGYGSITECANIGDITGFTYAGGIVGGICGESSISYSYNQASVSARDYAAAGIVGSNEGGESIQLSSVYSSATAEDGLTSPFDGVAYTANITGGVFAEICVDDNFCTSGENIFGYAGIERFYPDYQVNIEGYRSLSDDEEITTMEALVAALNNGGKAFTYKEGAWPVLTWEAQSEAVSPEELEAAVEAAKTEIEAACEDSSAYDALCAAKASSLVEAAKAELAKATTIKEVNKIKTDTVAALNDIPTAAYKTTKKQALDGYLEGNYNAEEWAVIADSKTELEKTVTASVSKAEIDAKVTEATATAADVITKADKDKAFSDLDAAYAAYNQEEYSEGNWEKLTQIYNKARTDIESSHSKTAILGKSGIGGSIGLLSRARNEMKAVESKIVALRSQKIAEFEAYFEANYKQADYSAEQWKKITNPKSTSQNKGYYNNAVRNLGTATNEEAMDEIISTAKENMEGVYTLKQEAELESYKIRLKAELDSRLAGIDKSKYYDTDYTQIERSITAQKRNIDDNAHTFEDVDGYYNNAISSINNTVTIEQRDEQLARIEAVYLSCNENRSKYDDTEWAKIESAYASRTTLSAYAELSAVKQQADRIIRNMTNAMTRDELANFETSRNDVLALLKAEYEKYESKKSDYDQSCKADEEGWAKLEKIYNTAVTDIKKVEKDKGKSAMTEIYEQAAADMAAVVSLKAKREACASELTAVGQGYSTSGLYNDKGKSKLESIVNDTIAAMNAATSVKAIDKLFETSKTQLANVLENSGETELNAAIESAVEAFKAYFDKNYPTSNQDRYEAEDWTKLHKILDETVEKMQAVYTKSYSDDLKKIETAAKSELKKITLKNAKLAALVIESMEQIGKSFTSNTALLDAAKENLLEAFASFAYDLFEAKGESALTAAIDAAKTNLKELYDGAKAALEALGSSKEIEKKTAELLSEMDSVTQTALSIENTVAEADKWDGKTTSKPTEGDGSKENPYVIGTAAELAWFAAEVNGGNSSLNAKLSQDIDLAGHIWTAIGAGGINATGFSGSFDGQGHTVHNLYVDTEGMSGSVYCGLFGMADEGSTIKDLHVAGEIHFANKSDDKLKNAAFGGIAGCLKDGVIYNCISSIKVTRHGNTSGVQVGGIAGMMKGGTIERCDSHAVFVNENMCDYVNAGGIVGSVSGNGSKYAMIRYCTYNGSLKAAGSYIGGIAGSTQDGAIIRECINNAEIGNGKGAAASAFVGGITGYAVGNSKLMYVYNHGSITGDNTTSGNDDGTGGIIGGVGNKSGAADINANPLISYAYNDGAVSSSKNARVGGLAGRITKGTVSESQSCSDNRMFGYVENSGTGVDNSILTDSISFVSSGKDDSTDMALAKFDATQTLKAMYRMLRDSVYGTQSKAYNDLIDSYIRKIEEAKSDAAISELLTEAKTELAKVMTQLDSDKEAAISELRLYVASRVYDSKKADGQEQSVAEQVNAALEAALSEVEKATTVKEVEAVLEKYLGTDEAAGQLAYFETYNTQTVKGLYSDFLYNKAYNTEDLAKVQAAYDRWAAAIEAADSEKRINELAAEAKQELTELTKDMQLRAEGENAGLPSFAADEADALKAEKDKAYRELSAQYNWKDYGDDEWGEISAIFAALQTSLNAAKDSTELTAAVNNAKASLDAVSTLEAQALLIAQQDAEKSLSDKVTELIQKLKDFFAGEKEKIGEDKFNASSLKPVLEKSKNDGEAAIENAAKDEDGNALNFTNLTMSQIRESLDTAIAKAEAAFESAKQKLGSLFDKISKNDENAWDGTTLAQPQGSGSEKDPYKLATAAELAWFAALVNDELGGEFAGGNQSANAVLTADINLGYQNWKAIGVATTHAFQGSLDGDGHRIDGLYIASSADGEGADYYGLFGYISYGSEIKNLSVSGTIDVTIGKDDRVGGIAAYVYGGKIKDCISETEIQIDLGTTRDTMGCGGIAGEASSAAISDCENRGNITAECGTSNYAKGLGGIVGYAAGYDSSCKIERCINNGEIHAYKAVGTGGIIGFANNITLSINECVNTADITIEVITDTYGKGGTGGIIGAAGLGEKNGDIKNVYNTGKIKAESMAGGILGGECTSYQYTGMSGGLTESVTSGAPNLKLAYVYNAGRIDGPNAQVSNKMASIVGLPVEGSYMTNLFMVEGSAKSAMGYISTKGNKITTIGSAELREKAAKDVFSTDSTAVESIADINEGYPIFAWQLLMSENRTQIKNYLNGYYEQYVKPIASKSQCARIESVLEEKLATIASAGAAEAVISAYKAALAAMDVSAVLEQARKEANGKLEGIDVSKYPQHLQEDISEFLEAQRQKIAKAENAKKMDEAVDAAYVGIVDILITDIENPKFEPASSTSEAAAAYKEKTELAKAEYGKLTDTQKESVSGYIKLAQAEEKYQEYLERSAANEVDALIAAIGTVSTSSASKIKAARAAYNALTANEKKYVAMLAVLEKAEAAYASLVTKEAGANDVIAKIDEIGKVTLESYDKIMSAMKAYNALTQGQARMVPADKLETLKSAMAKYNALLEAAKTGNVIVNLTPTVQGQSSSAELKAELLADAVDTALQIAANTIIINIEDAGETIKDVLLAMNFDELRSIAEGGKTGVKIRTSFGEIRLNSEELKRLIEKNGAETTLIRIDANGNNLGLSMAETEKEEQADNRAEAPAPVFNSSGYSQLPMLPGKNPGTVTTEATASKETGAENSSPFTGNELVQITQDNPLAEPKKPFDWSIVLMLLGIAAAGGIGGGLFKWFAAARNSRRS